MTIAAIHHGSRATYAWTTREALASAIFAWIEGLYNPTRRHSGLGYRSPNNFEDQHSAATAAA